MVIRTCERCFKEFNLKGDYTRHINRKKPCHEVRVYYENKIILDNKKLETTPKQNYIYLLEMFNLNLNKKIYKVGKTTRYAQCRMKEYKCAKLLFMLEVDNCHITETEILLDFANDINIIKEQSIGTEYFSCDSKKYIITKFFNDINLVDNTIKIQSVDVDSKKNICNYCNKLFGTNSNMHRHIRSYCKIKKQQDILKQELYTKLVEQKKEQDDRLTEKKKLTGKSKRRVLQEELEKKNKEIEELDKKNKEISNSKQKEIDELQNKIKELQQQATSYNIQYY
jgi:hypothetical protein